MGEHTQHRERHARDLERLPAVPGRASSAQSGWRDKFRRLPYGRGVGVAGSMYISGTNYCIYPNEMPQAAVQLKLDRSGRATVFSGCSDIGQGVDSVLAYIVCEELGLELRDVRVVAADTDLTPVDLGSYSSRETFMVGNACLDAARALREKIAATLAERWGVPKGEIVLAGGVACATGNPRELAMSVKDAFQAAEAQHGTLGSVGWYQSPKLGGDYRGGTIGASPAYSFTAHVAEVDCDPETGVVNVTDIWVAHDCGRALNPVNVEGQMEGSAYMGFAEALMETQVYKPAAPGHPFGLHHGPSAARLSHADLARHAEAALDHRRVGGPGRALRREGGGRGPAAPEHPGDRERHLRRARRALRPAAVRPAARAVAAARRRRARALGARPRAGREGVTC